MVADTITLYCCSFYRDLRRVIRLAESVKNFNKDSLPFYISCPRGDVDIFKRELRKFSAIVVNEEDIISKIPNVKISDIYSISHGKLSQQVIKSEFWRLGVAKNTVVLDSDCVFIRPFYRSDFMATEDVPYSVIHEGRSFLRFVSRFGPVRARSEWLKDRKPIKDAIGRKGVTYDYGYAPFIWSSEVWRSLYSEFLEPNGMSILDAVKYCPSELTWYGEALLAFRAIPVWPREELFRHYHYEHEYWFDCKLGIGTAELAKDYLGVVYQSNWQRSTDYGGDVKGVFSRGARSFRRVTKWIRFQLGLR